MSIEVKTYYQTPNTADSVNDSDFLVVQQMNGSTIPEFDQMKKATVGTILSGVVKGVKLNGVEVEKDSERFVNLVIPIAHNSTVTLKTNDGTAIDSFTLNQNTDKTISFPASFDNVSDVLVDGVSAVENKVAKIPLYLKANLESPEFTGIPTVPTANINTNNKQIASTAFVQTEIARKLEVAQALIYKGTVSRASDLPTAGVKIGWTYISNGNFLIGSEPIEPGDMIIAKTSDPTWSVVNTNVDGAVAGPTTSIDNHFAVFNGTTGKSIKDSGVSIGTAAGKNIGGNIGDVPSLGNTLVSGAVIISDANGFLISHPDGELKSAAFKNSNEFATSAQGILANNAVRSVASGTTNGTISVKAGEGAAVDVKVFGLDEAAYRAVDDTKGGTEGSTALITSGAVNEAISSVVTTEDELPSTPTPRDADTLNGYSSSDIKGTKASVTLKANSWTGASSPYTQTITVPGTTVNSKIDIQMDEAAIIIMLNSGVKAMYVGNSLGVLTVYSIGSKPSFDMNIQVVRTELNPSA